MSFLGQLKAAVGVTGAAAHVEMVLERLDFCLGEDIRGQVRIEGGYIEQFATELRVFVEEAWEGAEIEGRSSENDRKHQEQVLARHLLIEPGSLQTFEFDIRAPWGDIERSEWSVVAEACVPHSLHPRVAIPIELLPPVPLCGLVRALEEVAPFVPKRISNQEQTAATEACFEFLPPDSMRPRLNGLTLRARLEGEQVVGVFEIHPHEKGIGGQIHTLTHSNWLRHEFAFEAEPLATWRQTPRRPIPLEVIKQFRIWLEPYND